MGLLDVFNSEQGRMGLGLLGGSIGLAVREHLPGVKDGHSGVCRGRIKAQRR